MNERLPITAHRTMIVEAQASASDQERIPCVLSTEAPVPRGHYLEVLQHEEGAVDLTRAPLPLLIGHDGDSLPIGRIEGLRVADRMLRGEIVLGASARAQEVRTEIASGTFRSLSVGYLIEQFESRPHPDGDLLVATRWQPFEASLVAIPADPGAGLFRSHTMPNATQATPSPDQLGMLSERRRVSEIRSLCTEHGASIPQFERLADAAICNGTPVQAFRAQLMTALADRDTQAGGHFNRSDELHVTGRGGDFNEAVTDGMLLRAGFRIASPHPAAQDFKSRSLASIAELCLSRAGRAVSAGDMASPAKLFERAMSTSDFGGLLSDSLGKALRAGMEAESVSHRQWAVVSLANDFRTQSRILLGSAPDLEEVAELGEYTSGAFEEDRSTLRPTKFGRIVSLSWESLLADNLGAFLGMGRALGAAAMRREADALYDLLLTNSGSGQTMQDSVALFDATHSNIATAVTGTGKPLTAAALGIARAKLRRQTGVGGGLLNLTPRVLIVPPERETEAEILVASSTVHTAMAGADSVTPSWIGGLTVIAEPRLSATDTFYVVADPSMIGTAEIAVIDNSPEITEIEEKRRDVLSWKCRHAFAVGFLDYRGIVKVTLSAA